MPVTYNSKSGADLGEICFTYTSTLTEYTGELCDPTWPVGRGASLTTITPTRCSTTKSLDGCKLPGPAAAANTAAQQPPPTPGLYLASNGFGQVMALYQTGHSTLASSLWNGADGLAPLRSPPDWATSAREWSIHCPPRPSPPGRRRA